MAFAEDKASIKAYVDTLQDDNEFHVKIVRIFLLITKLFRDYISTYLATMPVESNRGVELLEGKIAEIANDFDTDNLIFYPRPGVPGNLAAAAGNEQITFTFDSVEAPDRNPVLYDLRYRIGAGAFTVIEGVQSGYVLGARDSEEIMNGTTYKGSVRARNIHGPSDWSAEVPATPSA